MTLEQLRIFLAVAEELNMTRAATRVNLSQPAVSAAIAALEERYATRLFERVGRGLELSEAGRLFVPEARAVLTRAAQARRLLAELNDLTRGEIRIAASQTVATYWLPGRMARFAAAAPHVALHLTVTNTARAAAQVAAGEVDIAFVEGDVTEASLSQRHVGGDRTALYAAAGHPLAKRALTKSDLQSATWVMREPGSGTRHHLAVGFAKSRLQIEKLRIALELPSNGAVLEALNGSGLITAVSALAADSRVRAGQIKELRWPLPAREFTQLLHRERRPSRALCAFIASFDKSAGQRG